MDLINAKQIANTESLYNIDWYDEKNLRENQVGIAKDNNQWFVYVTDERASIIESSILKFDFEEKALDVLIRKARFGKKNIV